MQASKKWIRRLSGIFLGLGTTTYALMAQIDERGVDTTSTGYRVGRELGSWLPFLVIVILAMLVIYNSYRFSQKEKRK